MLSQKDAVHNAVMSVAKEHGIKMVDGQPISKSLTREHRAQINAILVQGFKGNTITLETSFADDSELKAYVSGLQSNWLRKDTRLNGGAKYEPANPGIRSGNSDASIREMRKLLEGVTKATERAEIQACIEERLSQINPPKGNKPGLKVDTSVIPTKLHKYASAS